MELFLFDRTEKIIHFEDLSILTNKRKIDGLANFVMSENEVFVFQIALVSDCDDVITSVSACGNVDISCINTDVTDKFGNKKTQCVNIKKDTIQPLFFTAKAKKLGNRQEKCTVSIVTEKESRSFNTVFNINTSPIENNGYNELWRLSRIDWLNSDLCIDDSIVEPYNTPEISNGRLKILGREIEIGNNFFIGSNTCIHAKESVLIGDNVIISNNVLITDNNNHPTSPAKRIEMSKCQNYQTDPLWSWENADSAPVYISDNVWIGRDAVILKGVTIGKGSIVGLRAVVTHDVPPYSVVAGNPARVVKILQ